MSRKAEHTVGYYLPEATPTHSTDKNVSPPLIIIGSGPVGLRLAQEILSREPMAAVSVFGNEPYSPYNRVQLSSVLAGDVARNSIDLVMPNPQQHPNFSFTICAIHTIDRSKQQLTDALGNIHRYGKLVIATGSRAFVPNIPGIDLKGVYTFRSLKDTDHLYARISSSRHVVVVGGGLLGIEAARALQRFNTKVTLIQQGSRLMNRQLDDEAAAQLLTDIKALSIDVIVESGVRVVHGDSRVDAVTTRNGDHIPCDTVVFCTGISPNIELARAAYLRVNQGIVVDDGLQTSDPDIFAIGECCEHRGQSYGLVSPGLEQAAVLADILTGGSAQYQGSQQLARLKVLGNAVVSMGEVADFSRHGRQKQYIFRGDQHYRKLVLHHGRLIGLVGIGEWPDLSRLQEIYQQKRRLYPWQLWFFHRTGKLWPGKTASDVNLWPKASIVCQCNNINQGTLVDAIDAGCNSFSQLSAQTGAATVCGSCKPLLQQLLGYQGPVETEKTWLPVLLASFTALLLATALFFIPGFSTADSVQQTSQFQSIWNDKFWKQVSGFSLLTLAIIGLLMSLRKRINSKRLGEFAYWRLMHILLGVFCISTLILHTGFHLGHNLNQLLMINFLLVISLGSLAGFTLSFSNRFSPAFSQRIRKSMNWLHILVTWPLPILLGAHIFSVYYF